jgi:hypothetical protein
MIDPTRHPPSFAFGKGNDLVLTSGVMGLFTGPHHTLLSEPSSLTMRLSDGERPVLAPE